MAPEDQIGMKNILGSLFKEATPAREMPQRYKKMLRNPRAVVLTVVLLPLTTMTILGFMQYHRALLAEAVTPFNTLAARTRHWFQLFLEERLNLLRLISSAYDINSLCDNRNLERILGLLRSEFGGFVDLGLIDGETGIQVTYSAPYDLKGKNYAEQPWFHEVLVTGSFISDVFLGHRRFPHFAMGVIKRSPDGSIWILRATFNTARFEDIVVSMGLASEADAFVINKEGFLQTKSRFFGDILTKIPLEIPSGVFTSLIKEYKAPDGKSFL